MLQLIGLATVVYFAWSWGIISFIALMIVTALGVLI